MVTDFMQCLVSADPEGVTRTFGDSDCACARRGAPAPSWISRSISSGYSMPLAAQSLGYMLMEVKPGMVFTSLR